MISTSCQSCGVMDTIDNVDDVVSDHITDFQTEKIRALACILSTEIKHYNKCLVG